jgi:hypothetical protein
LKSRKVAVQSQTSAVIPACQAAGMAKVEDPAQTWRESIKNVKNIK